MQTFMPHPDFAASAMTLDRQRLGKQRVEGMQVLNALAPDYPHRGWRNHPAVLMWRGHEGALARYVLAVCREWTSRGYKDTIAPRMEALISTHPEWNHDLPPWMGDEEFHRSHQANLVRKDPAWYGPQFPDADPNAPYKWPTAMAA